MNRSYWLLKSEPEAYSYDDLVRDRRTPWDGVRNFEARNNLRKAARGDLALFYHSGKARAVVGVAKVVASAYQDPTSDDERWVCVDVEPVTPLVEPVSLARIKDDEGLMGFALVRRARLSVAPATAAEFKRVLKLGKTQLP